MLVPCVSQTKDFCEKIKRPISKTIDIQKNIQKQEDRWNEDRLKLINEYNKLKQEVEDLTYQNKEFEAEKKLIKDSISDLEKRIKSIDEISRELNPYLKDVYNQLCSFVEIDLPFLTVERSQRLLNLKKILDDPTKPISEKYRKLMEAIFIEAEYGNTVETYEDKIKIDGEEIYGNIFRLGRVAIFFLSPDRKITAFYSVSKNKWIKLPLKYARQINMAIDISNKRRSIDLLLLPIGKIGVSNENN